MIVGKELILSVNTIFSLLQPEGIEKEYTFNSLVCPKGIFAFDLVLFIFHHFFASSLPAFACLI